MVEQAKALALKFLSYRLRTVQEVRLFLQKKKFNQNVIEEVIKYLQEISYLDDMQFCELWIRNRLLLKPMGRKRLYDELINKGVDPSIVEQVLEEKIPAEMDLFLARELVYKKIVKATENGWPIEEKKLKNFLYRRGFNYYTIEKVIKEIFSD